MADDAFKFWIHPVRRAECAVYAVAIGDRLGMDLGALKRLRAAMETSTLTGDKELDGILEFVEGLGRIESADARLNAAYEAVAPLIQPLGWDA